MASGLTPVYQLPYPIQTDSVDVAADVQSLATAVEGKLLIKASLDSPTLTGIPKSTTAAADTNTTQIATTAFVIGQSYLKTTTASTTYAPKISPTFTGTPSAPTAVIGTNTTQIATTAFVKTAIDNIVSLPSQSGNSGKYLKTDGTTASWQTIVHTDISGLSTNYAPLNISFSQQSASYSLVLGDAAKQVEINNGSANTLTVPPSTSVNYPVGTVIVVVQTGAGQTTITPGSGVTINGTPGLKLRTQWSVATLTKRASDTWLAAGDLVA
jgi:hypothetical protein